MASAPVAIAVNQSLDNNNAPMLSVLSESLSRVAANASSLIERFTNAAKASYEKYEALCASKTTNESTAPTLSIATDNTGKLTAALSEVPAPTFGENEDLETMIQWFKSYGIDRPLILDSHPTQFTDRKAA